MTSRSFRAELYDGRVAQLPPTAPALGLVSEARALLATELGVAVDGVRDAQARLGEADFFARIGRVRRILYLEPRFHDGVRTLLSAAGFDPTRIAFDPLRLRVVAHRGHENARAAPVYYAHRDTWYAHSQSVLTFWLALDPLHADETFVFYPDQFGRAVPNDSESFDYDEWVRQGWSLKIGWQDREAGLRARYPRLLGPVEPGPAVGFSCHAGEAVVFSGAQLHQTLPHAAGRTRFSLDLRLVHLDDHASGLGAPNVDNRSRGCALRDFVQPP